APHRHPLSFPTRRSSDLPSIGRPCACGPISLKRTAISGMHSNTKASSRKQWLVFEKAYAFSPILLRRTATWGLHFTSSATCAERSEEHTSELQSPCNLVC